MVITNFRMQDETPLARRHRPDILMALFLAILLLLGLIVIFSISPALVERINSGGFALDQNHFLYKQLIYLGIGVTAFVVAALIPITFWKRVKSKLLIGSIILATLPIILAATPLALCANGACRWLDLGIISFQPAELIKLALCVFLAAFLAVRIKQGELNDTKKTLIPLGILMTIIAMVVVGFQKDLGTGMAIFAIVMTMLFVAGLRLRYLAMVVAIVFGAVVAFILVAPHRLERVMTFFNHQSSTAEGMGYHINQALIAVGSGGMFGKGLGQSIQVFGYLPEAANDSIFAILAEKFGFLGTVAVLVIFAALFYRIIKIMRQIDNTYLRLIVAGIFGWVFSHTALNIGSMLGVFPLTGVTLPFVSFGGTSLLLMLLALGLVFNISRYTTHQLDLNSEKGGQHSDHSFGRGRVRRTRHTSSSSS